MGPRRSTPRHGTEAAGAASRPPRRFGMREGGISVIYAAAEHRRGTSPSTTRHGSCRRPPASRCSPSSRRRARPAAAGSAPRSDARARHAARDAGSRAAHATSRRSTASRTQSANACGVLRIAHVLAELVQVVGQAAGADDQHAAARSGASAPPRPQRRRGIHVTGSETWNTGTSACAEQVPQRHPRAMVEAAAARRAPGQAGAASRRDRIGRQFRRARRRCTATGTAPRRIRRSRGSSAAPRWPSPARRVSSSAATPPAPRTGRGRARPMLLQLGPARPGSTAKVGDAVGDEQGRAAGITGLRWLGAAWRPR